MAERNIMYQTQLIKDYSSGARARATFDHAHWENHQGKLFSVEYDDPSLGAAAYIAVAFKSPLTGQIHMYADFSAKAEAILNVIEGASYSGGQTGAQVDILNRNRQSANVGSLLTDWRANSVYEASGNVHVGMSGLAGTIIDNDHVYGTNRGGVKGRGQHEMILQSGTVYAYQLLAVAGSNGGSIKLTWYEED